MAESLYSVAVQHANGRPDMLVAYQDRVLLIVNTASQCGFTRQYAGLEELHRKYKDRGLTVLAFPCNQFGQQEPGDEEEIKTFCSLTYDVTFPIMKKIDVNGPNTAPLYRRLKQEKRGFLGTPAIKWNFTKFLVDRSGKVVGRFAPTVEPRALEGAIERLL